MKKKINFMGLSELMRMIIIFVTFCLNKKKVKKMHSNMHQKKTQKLQLTSCHGTCGSLIEFPFEFCPSSPVPMPLTWFSTSLSPP